MRKMASVSSFVHLGVLCGEDFENLYHRGHGVSQRNATEEDNYSFS
jgi:hypothetical protein